MKEQEVIDAVANINEELFDKYGPKVDFVPTLNFRTNGTSSAVDFGDYPLWDTEDYDSPYIDDGNTQEPIEDYLRRRLVDYVATLAKAVLP